ncbi:30S ribosomal protein S12 methylthiotransferase RimO [Fervidobacterium thailandense]|uniref:Ribosomal protein uS12 methylthiotransferase RimO n=1 Tax=Fervidobacterium thailandense TaxID=1008305 RepID=A0A1E3G1F4_9BACT|nr:30S ribosomal protein S12 methylthiotransferase RimO [Fervidobacterium thailandense]ODN30076.1 ribosomal protein S12 methylthiotransferase RimO [Fervidobacterium thailandense]
MRLYIVTLGCPKNEADFALFKYHLIQAGHQVVEDVEDADGVVINTCGFILDAKRESIDTILEFAEYKKKRPDFKIFVVGCLVQRYPDELISELPEVNGWFGVIPPKVLAENIDRVSKYVTDPVAVYHFEGRVDDKMPYAYVKIADGCDRACTFCTIPKFKGGFVSREIEDIVREVEYLLRKGKREIILVAQDTTGYGVDNYGYQALPKLLERLNQLDGEFWIRVMYMHPDHVTDEIIEAFSYDKVLKYFDVPVQHGSDKILRLMGRTKTSAELKALFEKIRERYPDAVLRTSIIVGFPGETREDFEQLLDFIRYVEFDKLGAFMYSEEEDAASAKLPGKVSKRTAQSRLDKLMELQAEISFIRNRRYLGKVIDVLFEEMVEGVLIGRGYMDAPEIDGNIFVRATKSLEEINGFAKVLVYETDTYDLEGELVG